MPVDACHKQYTDRKAIWQRCRDVQDGQDCIKAKTTTYLPLLEAHESAQDPEYVSYLQRAYFYNGTGRTAEAHAGYVFRKDPVVAVPKAIEPFLQDITLGVESFVAFAGRAFDQIVNPSRAGVLVDYSDEDKRPYLVLYRAEQIINWQATIANGKVITTRVVLEEEVEKAGKDEYTSECVKQYRHLYLDGTGRYQVDVYRQASERDKTLGRVGDTKSPTRNGVALDFIPFQPLNPTTLTWAIEKPVLLDLVNANLALYTVMADRRHGAHFCALPTPWVTGVPSTVKALKIGGAAAWILEKDGQAGMLEMTGKGLESLKELIEDLKHEMAVLGSRVLEEEPATQETATAVELRQSGGTATLKRMALTASAAFTRVMQWVSWWAGASATPTDEKVTVQLNRDFLAATIDPRLLTEMTKALQEGAISKETYYAFLERGELTIPSRTFEEEQKAIDAEREEAQGRADAAMADAQARLAAEGGAPNPTDQPPGGNQGDNAGANDA